MPKLWHGFRKLQGLTCKQKQDVLAHEACIFDTTWAKYADESEVAINNKDVNESHRIWCKAAEHFLWNLEYPGEDMPTHFPPRGQVLPKRPQKVAEKKCDVTRIPRNHFTNRVDGILGLAYDTRSRIRRLMNNTQRKDDDTDIFENEDATQVTMNFDEKCAHLIDATYEDEDYDALTLFKTSKRLNNKLHKFPDDIRTALDTHDNEQDEDDDIGFNDNLYEKLTTEDGATDDDDSDGGGDDDGRSPRSFAWSWRRRRW